MVTVLLPPYLLLLLLLLSVGESCMYQVLDHIRVGISPQSCPKVVNADHSTVKVFPLVSAAFRVCGLSTAGNPTLPYHLRLPYISESMRNSYMYTQLVFASPFLHDNNN